MFFYREEFTMGSTATTETFAEAKERLAEEAKKKADMETKMSEEFERQRNEENATRGSGETSTVPTNQQLINETRTTLLGLVKNLGSATRRPKTNLGPETSPLGEQTDAIEVLTSLLGYLEEQVAKGRQ